MFADLGHFNKQAIQVRNHKTIYDCIYVGKGKYKIDVFTREPKEYIYAYCVTGIFRFNKKLERCTN